MAKNLSGDQPSSRIRRTPIATAARSAGEMSAMRSWRRSLAMARVWSVTATTSRPAQLTGTSRGGAGCGEVESGTTTTVRRRSLTMLVERIRHGRVLLVSEPDVGSSRTHQTSPRRGIVPLLRYIAGYGVEFPLDRENILILIWEVTRTSQLLVLHLQFCLERLCHITGPVPRGNALEQLRRQGLWKGKGHLSGRHNAIRNQSAQCHLLWQCRTVCISCGVGQFGPHPPFGRLFGAMRESSYPGIAG